MKPLARFLLAASLAAVTTAPAGAKAVTDCPMQDAPFSIDTPLVDLMASPAAGAVLDRATHGRISQAAPSTTASTGSSFLAIMTLRASGRITGVEAEELPAIDAALRALPVTAPDKVARCARYDNDVPRFALPKGKPRLLLFEKITGFRDGPSVDAAHAAFVAMAERKGWAIATTDKGGAINPAALRQFDAVIWNNISGDVLTLSQRRALQNYIERGGAFIAVHGSAGDPSYNWDWYVDTLLGARFIAHPMDPQFQDARVVVDKNHPIAAALPAEWTMNDEWYSFRTNPRAVGAHVIATLDETTYSPVGRGNQDLRMGDHPIAWTNCISRGRMFYSAIGHRPETYSEPHHVAMLEAAIDWAAVSGKDDCPARPAAGK
jgi:type 1 glutamine amidotransferase